MNLNKLYIIIYMIFVASGAFSQRDMIKYPSIELKGSDTVIIFKIEQGRKLAKFNEERKKLLKISEIQEKQLSEKDSIIKKQQSVIDTYVSIENKQCLIISEYKKQNEICTEEQKLINKELKRQKRYKLTAIISGITINIFTLWITTKH